MRRKDRQMDEDFGFKIIDQSRYGTISMVDEEQGAYGIPLSIVRDGRVLYFHSAKEGKKVSVLENNPIVSISFVGEVKVPENYTKEELDQIANDQAKAALFISNVFTTEYESAVVSGKVELVEEEEEKIQAMKMICIKYTPSKMDYFEVAIKAGLKRTNVYKVKIEIITAKRKKYDVSGNENSRQGAKT